jgi:hypothetical protein
MSHPVAGRGRHQSCQMGSANLGDVLLGVQGILPCLPERIRGSSNQGSLRRRLGHRQQASAEPARARRIVGARSLLPTQPSRVGVPSKKIYPRSS